MLAPMPTRTLLALVFPEGFLLLLVLALVRWGESIPEAAPALALFPLVVLATGAFLGWRFERGRLLLALAALVVAERALRWLVPLESDAMHAGPVVVRTIAVLLPATFTVLAFLPERGLRTPSGMRLLAVLAGEVALLLTVWLLTDIDPAVTAQVLDVVVLPSGMLAWFPLGQPAAILAAMAIAALVARAVWRPDAATRGFLWAAIASVVAASVGPEGGRATPYLAAAGLVLVVAAVEGIYAMAYHDELTGLPARRALNDALSRVGGTYTVAMVDVDHFKQFNDTHGHDVGDQVLRMVAGRLARVAGGGRAYRYGGEEFAVLFPGKSAEQSAPFLEALREEVAGASFTQRGRDRPRRKPKAARVRTAGARPLTVTVSIGAAQARGTALPADVVKAADKALYRAKEGGRNRVAM